MDDLKEHLEKMKIVVKELREHMNGSAARVCPFKPP
jgi:hypothetical protein